MPFVPPFAAKYRRFYYPSLPLDYWVIANHLNTKENICSVHILPAQRPSESYAADIIRQFQQLP
jgi:hypothetical protein